MKHFSSLSCANLCVQRDWSLWWWLHEPTCHTATADPENTGPSELHHHSAVTLLKNTVHDNQFEICNKQCKLRCLHETKEPRKWLSPGKYCTVTLLHACTFCEFKAPPPFSSGYLNWYCRVNIIELRFLHLLDQKMTFTIFRIKIPMKILLNVTLGLITF
jgi:hypothetical protein